ncbi:MAG: heavy-metal-associated domain-containing protein [Clostridiales bacterium]|nr:heavy-metal-associated domain-containing protein [Clostridiales bacterium]MCD8216196.1 heavy-metal-associated domain-containing protein [Clostridiales bacterium]
MNKITMKVDGMMCNMCEAHACDAVRRVLDGKPKVSASHKAGTVEIITEGSPDMTAVKKAITELGYKVLDVSSAPYEKKGLFGFRK